MFSDKHCRISLCIYGNIKNINDIDELDSEDIMDNVNRVSRNWKVTMRRKLLLNIMWI